MNTTEEKTFRLRLHQLIKDKKAVVGIIGLGYVGLPLGLHFAQKGINVLGFDVDETKIDQLRRGASYIKHVPADTIKDSIKRKLLDVTFDFTRLNEPDCILICVPTPLTDKMEPDMSYLVETTNNIAE